MNRINVLKARLQKISAIHDSPPGLMHPYWARKPLNIVSEIIKCLTTSKSIVADPFMGSGTTVFASLMQNRHVIGSDINPLAVFLVKSILELSSNTNKKIKEAEKFVAEFCEVVLPWFQFDEDKRYIERERFIVKGSYENGQFSLNLDEIVTKKFEFNRWKSRIVHAPSEDFKLKNIPRKYLNSPIDFEKLTLIPNSRIAIPKGANLSHFYSKENIAAINCALYMINRKNVPNSIKNILRLLLSSSLPLLRLSDKKASSQWPYWRPKNMLTSRNPVIMLQKRLATLHELVQWASSSLDRFIITNIKNIFIESEYPVVSIANIAAQDLLKIFPSNNLVDLILTDPPYIDHVPYLEYSSQWIKLLNLTLPKNAFNYEIVKSDSPERLSDTAQYLKRLLEGFENCCKILKPNGYLVWFYQDHNLRQWSAIHKTSKANGVEIQEIIPVSKQRRSMKTVTSPGKTLDGDLICIFKKVKKISKQKPLEFFKMRRKFLKIIKTLPINHNIFDLYTTLIKFSFQENWIEEICKIESDARKALKALMSG